MKAVLGGVLVLCSNSKSKWHLRKKTNPAVTRQLTAKPVHSRHLKKSLEAQSLLGCLRDRGKRITTG
jgi:hypothetical protein